MRDLIADLDERLERLSARIDRIGAHCRSNTTAIRTFNTSAKLSIQKQAEIQARLHVRGSGAR